MSIQSIDYQAINESQKKTWGLGNYQPIALQTYDMNEKLIRSLDPLPTQKVLDVACGSGNGVLVAGRRDCEVTGLDLIPAWIERARKRATTEGIKASFHIGDAQDLPFQDETFDVVFSALGVIFAPNQDKSASEMLRVCKPEGKVGVMSHAEGGVVDEMFSVLASYGPPRPQELNSPIRWGTEEGINDLLGGAIRSIENRKLDLHIYARSVEHQVNLFRNYYGPTINLFNNIPSEQQDELFGAMVELLEKYNVADDGTMVLKIDYQQTIAVRK